jgi:hypothetical protein
MIIFYLKIYLNNIFILKELFLILVYQKKLTTVFIPFDYFLKYFLFKNILKKYFYLKKLFNISISK